MKQRMDVGRVLAYLTTVIGISVSIGANIADTFVPAREGAVTHAAWKAMPVPTPEFGAVAGAAFWPLAVLLGVELIARVQWPSGRWYAALRYAGVSPVALVAAIVSYQHLHGLLDWWGESILTQLIGPLAIDGLMIAATAALMATRHRAAVESTDAGAVESTSRVESFEPTQSNGAVDRAVEQSTGLDSDAAAPSIESSGAVAVESGAGAPVDHAPAARVAQLHAVPDASAQSIKGDAVPAVVQAIKEAVEAGEITWPVKYEPARQHLKIGVPKIKAAVKELQDQGWSPVQDDEQAVGE